MDKRSQLIDILRKLSIDHGNLFVVGGTVRDLLFGKAASDLDLTVPAEPGKWAERIAKELGGATLVPLSDTPGEEAHRLVWKGEQIDIAAFREGVHSLEEDLLLRDFTINAIAMPASAYADGNLTKLIDPAGGFADIQQRTLRALPGTFSADPLRMLRGYRFFARLGFELTNCTRAAVRENAQQITRVASERISYEMRQIFDSQRTSQAVAMMAEDGLLRLVVPELYLAEGVDQPQEFHHLDVLGHSFLALEMAEKITNSPEQFFTSTELLAQVTSYLAEDGNRRRLKWAALLHDIGKPGTKKKSTEKGRTTFYGHDHLGKELFDQFAIRNRWSLQERGRVATLIDMHMQPFHLIDAERKQQLGKKGVLRFSRRAGEDLLGLFLVALSDTLAGNPKHQGAMSSELVKLFVLVEEVYRNDILPVTSAPPILTGRDLIDLGLSPGPQFKRILSALEGAQVEGEVQNRDEAMGFVETFLMQDDLPTQGKKATTCVK